MAAKKATGRPTKRFTAKEWKTIERMAYAQCTAAEIADYLGVAKGTLYSPLNRDRFTRVTRMKAAAAKFQVRQRQLREATKGNGPIGGIWWGKQHLGQSDRQQVTGRDGAPIEMTNTAVEHLAEAIEKVAGKASGDGS